MSKSPSVVEQLDGPRLIFTRPGRGVVELCHQQSDGAVLSILPLTKEQALLLGADLIRDAMRVRG